MTDKPRRGPPGAFFPLTNGRTGFVCVVLSFLCYLPCTSKHLENRFANALLVAAFGFALSSMYHVYKMGKEAKAEQDAEGENDARL